VLLNEQTPGARVPAYADDSSNPRANELQPQPPRKMRNFPNIAASAAVHACHHVLASRHVPIRRERVGAKRQSHGWKMLYHLCLVSDWRRRKPRT